MAIDLSTIQCTKCKQNKSRDNFPHDKRKKNGKGSHCKKCKNSATIAHRRENPDKHRASQKRFHASPKGKALNLAKRMKYKYNLTFHDYDEMLERQGNRCAICLSDKPRDRWGKFQVDHCHKTNRVRGLLCGSCNKMLARLNDDAIMFQRVIDYLNGLLQNVGPLPNWTPYQKPPSE